MGCTITGCRVPLTPPVATTIAGDIATLDREQGQLTRETYAARGRLNEARLTASPTIRSEIADALARNPVPSGAISIDTREDRTLLGRQFDTGVDARGSGAGDGVLQGVELHRLLQNYDPEILARTGLVPANLVALVASGLLGEVPVRYDA